MGAARRKSAAISTESNRMDLYAMFPSPVEAVFAHLADPARLGDWLPQVTAAAASTQSSGTGAEFPATVQVDGIQVAASGEVTAFEPPWLVGYRLFTGAQAASIRVTCTAQPGGTRLHIHQPDDAEPLTIDLARLGRDIHQAHARKGQSC
jgi:uncharacterized protein YndB with AHSA1/START domain